MLLRTSRLSICPALRDLNNTAERRSKRMLGLEGKATAKPKSLLMSADSRKGIADLRAKRNLRVKRPDPWHRANASLPAMADPALNGQDARQRLQACLNLVRKPVSQPPVEVS